MRTDSPKKHSIKLRFDNGSARLSIQTKISDPSINPENSHTLKHDKCN